MGSPWIEFTQRGVVASTVMGTRRMLVLPLDYTSLVFAGLFSTRRVCWTSPSAQPSAPTTTSTSAIPYLILR